MNICGILLHLKDEDRSVEAYSAMLREELLEDRILYVQESRSSFT
jgi:hypothetical protein